MMYLNVVILLLCIVLAGSVQEENVEIRMPGAKPKGTDSYLCSGFKVEKTFAINNKSDSVYVTKFEGLAVASKAHHVLLYACSEPPKEEIWDCRHHSICHDYTTIMFAWAKNAEPLSMPPEVSFKLDPKEHKFLVLQVHYAHELPELDNTGIHFRFQREETKYSGGIYLLARSFLKIPPGTPVVHGEMNCKVKSNIPLHPFAFRTHAHSLGVVITGYKYSPEKNTFIEIARGNPQWPQTFYPIVNNVSLNSNDYLVARCTYNSTLKKKAVYIGAESDDEMCNLYLMYYMESKSADTIYCTDEQNPAITKIIPKDSDTPLPPNPKLEHIALYDKNTSTTKHGHRGHLDVSDQNIINPRRKGELEEDLEKNYKLSSIKMPGAIPNMVDDYRCVAYKASALFPEIKSKNRGMVHIMGFLTDAKSDKAHHLIVSHCKVPRGKEGEIFQCLHHGMCSSKDSKIMYAWAKDAPGMNLPPDAGFTVQGDEYVVLQVHYKHPLQNPDHTSLQLKYTLNKPSFKAGMVLLLRTSLTIPPHTLKTSGDVNCRIKTEDPMYLFAYRTHAHTLGSVITGYQYSFDTKTKKNSLNPLEIARGDPQLPQTFYPMENYVEVEDGDILAARCTYDSSNMTTTTQIGMTSGDEMCNLYLMYYSKSDQDFIICYDEQEGKLEVPKDSSDKIHGRLKRQAISSPYSTNTNGGGGAYAQVPVYGTSLNGYPPPPGGAYNSLPMYQPMILPHSYIPIQPPPVYIPQQQYTNTKAQSFDYRDDLPPKAEIVEDEIPKLKDRKSPSSTFGNTLSRKSITNSLKSKTLYDSDLHPVPNWPPKATSDIFGQLSGVSLDVHGNAVIFHRGDRKWNADTFKRNNEYNGDRTKPIPQNTVLTLNPNGDIINAWGADMFFMPHMITIDSQNNVWVTDVALHQVMKFSPYGGTGAKKTPLIQLGKKFEPGSDKLHFCKPTSVAVTEDGRNFFVADGYCNSRIIKYQVRVDSNGYHQVSVDVILHWGEANGAGISSSLNNYAFNIPHGLTLAEDKGLICVADRENGRVQCFNILNGVFVKSYKPKVFGSSIYSVAYTPSNGGNLMALGGYEPFSFINGNKPQVYVLDINNENKVLSAFGKDVLQNPHDLAVSKDGSNVYTIELDPYKLTKFTNGKLLENNGPDAPPNIPPTETFETTPSSLTEHAKAVFNKHIENLGSYVPKTYITIVASVLSALLTLICSFCMIYKKCKKRGKGNMSRNKVQNSSWKSKKSLDLGDFLGRSKSGFTRLKTDEHDEDASSEDSDLEDFTVPALNA
ncbi:peptidyl-glycine alpha-amidating monooxygenase B isoform X2 [Lepeophtheirus salmonis]|uniref:peptidyl-glycine alpha-amidating monooxygenase B isoform X2 n=1 Tax=Lepeophtheirus salmonis TaxID=72036 RepID=UPI003AF37AA3